MNIRTLINRLESKARDHGEELEVVIPSFHEESLYFRVENCSNLLTLAHALPDSTYDGEFSEIGDCGDPNWLGSWAGEEFTAVCLYDA